METLERVKKVLKNREKAILSMSKKLDKVNSLNRTLLDALMTAIGRDEVLTFDERKAIKTETEDVINELSIPFHIQVEKSKHENSLRD